MENGVAYKPGDEVRVVEREGNGRRSERLSWHGKIVSVEYPWIRVRDKKGRIYERHAVNVITASGPISLERPGSPAPRVVPPKAVSTSSEPGSRFAGRPAHGFAWIERRRQTVAQFEWPELPKRRRKKSNGTNPAPVQTELQFGEERPAPKTKGAARTTAKKGSEKVKPTPVGKPSAPAKAESGISRRSTAGVPERSKSGSIKRPVSKSGQVPEKQKGHAVAAKPVGAPKDKRTRESGDKTPGSGSSKGARLKNAQKGTIAAGSSRTATKGHGPSKLSGRNVSAAGRKAPAAGGKNAAKSAIRLASTPSTKSNGLLLKESRPKPPSPKKKGSKAPGSAAKKLVGTTERGRAKVTPGKVAASRNRAVVKGKGSRRAGK